jgi:hypothetical protein
MDMADAPPPPADPTDDNAETATPRWVKVFGAIAVVLVVAVIVLLIAGRGGGHGPSRHAPASDAGQTGLPAGVTHAEP